MSRPGRDAPSVAHGPSTVTVMVRVGLLTTTRISGGAGLRGWLVFDAELASGSAGLPGDSDLVSVLVGGLPGVLPGELD